MLIDKHRPILQLRNNARLAMNKFYLNTPIAQHIRETKYCFSIDGVAQERSIEDSWRRVANTLASVEEHDTGTRENPVIRQAGVTRLIPSLLHLAWRHLFFLAPDQCS